MKFSGKIPFQEPNASHDMSVFSFRKDEILRKKKLIDLLFAEGNSFYIHPFKVLFLPTTLEQGQHAQVMITVGKRSFKHAVDRNRLRRQIREAYRLNKSDLYRFLAEKDQQCILALIYTSHSPMPAENLDSKIKAVIRRLQKEFDKDMNNPSPALSLNKIL